MTLRARAEGEMRSARRTLAAASRLSWRSASKGSTSSLLCCSDGEHGLKVPQKTEGSGRPRHTDTHTDTHDLNGPVYCLSAGRRNGRTGGVNRCKMLLLA